MQRRSFLTGLGTLLGGVLLEQAIPFNRVWSFPKNIVIRPTYDEINAITNKYIVPVLHDNVFKSSPLFAYLRSSVANRGLNDLMNDYVITGNPLEVGWDADAAL